MAKNAVVEITLDPELHAEFLAAASAENRAADDIVSDLVRDYVERQHVSAEYVGFLEAKVAVARQSIAAGEGRSNETVEASFAALRKQIETGGL